MSSDDVASSMFDSSSVEAIGAGWIAHRTVAVDTVGVAWPSVDTVDPVGVVTVTVDVYRLAITGTPA